MSTKTTEQPPFVGMWFVVGMYLKLDGKWTLRHKFEPGEFTVKFLPDGRYSESINMLPFIAARWTFDRETEHITIEYADSNAAEQRIFYMSKDKEMYLCSLPEKRVAPGPFTAEKWVLVRASTL